MFDFAANVKFCFFVLKVEKLVQCVIRSILLLMLERLLSNLIRFNLLKYSLILPLFLLHQRIFLLLLQIYHLRESWLVLKHHLEEFIFKHVCVCCEIHVPNIIVPLAWHLICKNLVYTLLKLGNLNKNAHCDLVVVHSLQLLEGPRKEMPLDYLSELLGSWPELSHRVDGLLL